MPTTPNFGIPYPDGEEDPNVPADMMALALFIDNLLKGLIPVSGSIGYGGSEDPAGAFWMLEDGRALNAVADASLAPLYALIGNKYGGVNNTNFCLPDSRGRGDVAPSNMGAGHGGNQVGNDRIQIAVGAVAGEVLHKLTGGEHGDHLHAAGGYFAAAHQHQHIAQIGMRGGTIRLKSPADGTLDWNGSTYTFLDTPGDTGGDAGGVAGSSSERHVVTSTASAPAVSGSSGGSTGFGLAPVGHNTVHPVICKNKIMRVR